MCSILGFCGKEFDYERVRAALLNTKSRGPDDTRIINTGDGWLGFNRLSIMGLTDHGMQPFIYKDFDVMSISQLEEGSDGTKLPSRYDSLTICNGEIYGFRPIKEYLMKKGYHFFSESDCEILPALYREYGTEMFNMLDAEFAMILYDLKKDSYIAARDPIGIRPLYYGISKAGNYLFASEPKNLLGLTERIMPFPPGHYFKDGEFVCYRDMAQTDQEIDGDLDTITEGIRRRLVNGVKKRLDSDSPHRLSPFRRT